MKGDVLRNGKCLEAYRKRLKNMPAKFDLRSLPVVDVWDFWIMVENEFPYDRIAKEHTLLVPIRKFSDEKKMNERERGELLKIKDELAKDKRFDIIISKLSHVRSVLGHYHLHCIKYGYVADLT